MSLFPEAIQAYLAGHNVRTAMLFKLDFTSEPTYLWNGNGKFTSDGHEWLGIGGIVSVSGLAQAVNGTAPETSFTLSFLEEGMLGKLKDDFDAEALDRPVIVYMQFFNDRDDKPRVGYDKPYPIWTGRMQVPRFVIDPDGNREISVSVESLFTLRSRPNYSMYTDADQEKRYPGDRGFEFVATLRNKVVTWPDF